MSVGAAVALSLLSDVLLAWLLVFRRREPALRVPDLAGAAAASVCFGVAKMVFVALVMHRPFLGIHVMHACLFLALPAFGALLALGWPRRATPGARRAAGVLALLLVAVGVYSSFIEPWMLRTERATVLLDPARSGRDELLVGVLADIQCRRVSAHEREAVALMMAAQPDLILLPGDLSHCASRSEWDALVPPLRELLATLHAPLGVYVVQGNTDNPANVRELLAGTQVQFLRDESVQRTWGDRHVTIGGVQLRVGADPARRLIAELSAPGGDDLRILLSHVPDAALLLPPGGRVDLVVAGHTHGGQVQVPWFGPLITLSDVPRAVAGGGLHLLNDAPIYVSRGIGHEHGDAPRVRFNCPPEISLLTLTTPAP